MIIVMPINTGEIMLKVVLSCLATMATMMFLIIIANLYPEQCSVNKVTKCQIKVSRMHTGPEIGGCKPVVVTFEDFKDREDVLR